jgi:general secretion pathway protein G
MTEGSGFKRSEWSNRGFSLVEMMVVFVLIGLLAGLVTVNVRGSLIKGKQNAARSEIATLRNALEQFYIDESRFPNNSEGLAVLAQTNSRRPQPLIQSVPKDPWNHPYQYNCPGRNNEPYEILCLGADGKEGGEGADMDIASYNLKDRGEK